MNKEAKEQEGVGEVVPLSRDISTPSLVIQPISNPLKENLELAISFIDKFVSPSPPSLSTY